MTNKAKKLGILITSVSLLAGGAAIVNRGGFRAPITSTADYSFSLTLDSASLTNESTFSVKTKAGNDIQFAQNGVVASTGAFGQFNAGASLENVSAISGITSITLAFPEGENGNIRVSYLLNGAWVSSVSLDSANPIFNFNGVQPSKFKLENTGANPVVVKSIEIDYSCTPAAHEFTRIEVSTNPTKTVYNIGEDFDGTGMVVTAYCGVSGHEDSIVVNDYQVVGGTNLTKDSVVTVKFGNLEVTVDVTVRDYIVVGEVGMVEYAATSSGTSEFKVPGLDQTITSITVGGTTYTEGFTTTTEGFTVDNSVLKTALGTKTYGDVKLELTVASNDTYEVSVSVVTKILRTVDDVKSMHISSGNLNGYYALACDIECSSLSNFKILENYNQEFTGIFDGKGHALKNANVNDMGLFRGTFNNAIIRNIAFVNLRTGGSTYKRPLGCTANGKKATFENVVLDCPNASQFVAGPLNESHLVKNCVMILPGSTKLVDSYYESSLVNNYVVGGADQTHASKDALLEALANGTATFTAESSLRYNDGALTICGNPVYEFLSYTCSDANNEVTRGSSVTLTSDNASFSLVNEVAGVTLTDGVLSVEDTVAANTLIEVRLTHKTVASVSKVITLKVINLFDEIVVPNEYLVDLSKDNMVLSAPLEGEVTTVRSANASLTTGFTYSDGQLTLSKASSQSLLGAKQYGENVDVEVLTNAKKLYKVKVTFATRLIGSADDIKLVKGNTVDGLYILTNDIDGSSLAGYQMLANWGDKFTGTFDGRGHVIYDAVVSDFGFFRGNLNNATVKNVGFKNLRHNGTSYMRVFGDSVVNSTMENVYVEAPTSKCFFAGSIDENSSKKMKNVVVITPVAEKFCDSAYRGNFVNCFAIASYTDGGTSKTYKTHDSTDALLSALEAGTVTLPAPYSYADGHLSFGSVVVL